MPRRLFYITFGAVVGVLVVRQAARAASALSPQSVAGSLVQSIREFAADVREAMAEREAEIRTALGIEDGPAADGLPPGDDDPDATVHIPRPFPRS
ncbi:MAG: hypothetical protein IRZ08_17455 [Frankia sp.]|nr:hypothetical protein [Frankia sp.]